MNNAYQLDVGRVVLALVFLFGHFGRDRGCEIPCVVVSFFLLLLKLIAYCFDSVYEGPVWGREGLPAKLNLRFSSRFDCSDDLFGTGTFTDSSQGLAK